MGFQSFIEFQLSAFVLESSPIWSLLLQQFLKVIHRPRRQLIKIICNAFLCRKEDVDEVLPLPFRNVEICKKKVNAEQQEWRCEDNA